MFSTISGCPDEKSKTKLSSTSSASFAVGLVVLVVVLCAVVLGFVLLVVVLSVVVFGVVGLIVVVVVVLLDLIVLVSMSDEYE